MKPRRWTLIMTAAVVAMTLTALAPSAPAQVARPGELPPLDAAARAAVIDSLTAAIDSVYVLQEPAERIVAGLRGYHAAGTYDEITDPAEFARRLYEDAQAIHHDGHFGIRALPPLDPDVAAADLDEDPAEEERERRRDKAENYGFRKAEILPGGVGYLRFDRFSRGDEAYAAAAAAMNFMANSNAVIIDLRFNGGGAAAMIRFLCGYLFPDSAHLINWDVRARGTTVQSYSADYVPGKRITEQPVYVLTSNRTFSAAEEFTFDLRNLERATVVGDTTGGGGHTVAGYVYDFDGFRMLIRIPYGRAYNPLTDEGWEGMGVLPHIAVPQDQALDAAYVDALRNMIEEEEDTMIRESYRWALARAEAKLDPVTFSKKELKAYAGDFGPRIVTFEDGVLWYQRNGRARHRLEPLGADLFKVGDLDYFMLEFGRDEDGRIDRVIGRYDNGQMDENPRSG